ncbi:PIN2/TERF1-interacting telomerase inhibitor 1 [Coelomomyces lativittatus]|nr:PIN2/TERF1-interacting telomerase inhibitor 1 [Coelomomyces lativittatus]
MLQKMGWEPGKGLGIHEQGQLKHVSVAMKNDTTGLGGSTHASATCVADNYSQLLAKLNVEIPSSNPTSIFTSATPTLPTPSMTQPLCRNPSRLKFVKQKKLSTSTSLTSLPPSPPSSERDLDHSPFAESEKKSDGSTPSSMSFGFVRGGTLIGDKVVPKDSDNLSCSLPPSEWDPLSKKKIKKNKKIKDKKIDSEIQVQSEEIKTPVETELNSMDLFKELKTKTKKRKGENDQEDKLAKKLRKQQRNEEKRKRKEEKKKGKELSSCE